MKLTRLALLTSFAACALSVAPLADARPNPDRAGTCYFFRGEKLELKESCVISTGYGAGGMYATLNWRDGVKTGITKVNYCPNQATVDGFCRYTVDGKDAAVIYRGRGLRRSTQKTSISLTCYEVKKTGNSVCYY